MLSSTLREDIMIRAILRWFTTRVVLTAAISLSGLVFAGLAAAAQSALKGPDGTLLACNFNFRLQVESTLQVGSDPMAASTNCDSYHIYLAKNRSDPAQATFTISQTGSTDRLTYHLADMPLNVPVLLLEPGRQPTRVIARRGADRIDFTVGRTPFTGPPPQTLLPRTPAAGSAATRAPGSGSQASATRPAPGTTVAPSALVGSWQTQGLILIFRADGTFQRVSHSSVGSFGGVLDDGGTYTVQGDQLSIDGNILKRACTFAVGPNTLTFCGTTYSRE
jgi:hypothetical protein